MNWLFYLSSAVAVAATLMMVTRLKAVHALLYLIVSLLAVALIFYVIGAPFVAALEVIIYAGAIMVLFLFVVMLMNLGRRAVEVDLDVRRKEERRADVVPGTHELVEPPAKDCFGFRFVDGLELSRSHSRSPSRVSRLGAYVLVQMHLGHPRMRS